MEVGSLREASSIPLSSAFSSPLFTSTPLLLEPPRLETELEKLKRALQSNIEYQAAIYDRLLVVNKLTAATAEKKRTLHGKYFATLPRRAGITLDQLRTAPFFFNATGEPEDNLDTIIKKKQRGDTPVIQEYRPFARDERRRLEAGIQAQGEERLMRAAQQAHMSRLVSGEEEKSSLSKYTAEQARIRQLSLVEHLLDSPQVDWNFVATQVKTRSATACMIEWTGKLDPRINRGKWSKVEDKKLIDLVKEHGDRSWPVVSLAMRNRTPMQCLQRYQRSHNSDLLLNKWTPDEDQQLAEAVQRFGTHNWPQVAACLKRRTDQQCLHRYLKTVDTQIKAGRWSAEEDERLCVAVAAYGSTSWIAIQKHVPSRTDVKCRERYMNILNPQVTRQPWTPMEDGKLLAYVRARGIRYLKWTEAAKILAPRTDNQVWRRWLKIADKDLVKQYKNLQASKEKTMVRNFVGRRGERPELDVVEVLGPAALQNGGLQQLSAAQTRQKLARQKRLALQQEQKTHQPSITDSGAEQPETSASASSSVSALAKPKRRKRPGPPSDLDAQSELSYIDCVASLVAQMTPGELQMLHTVMNSKPLLAQATAPLIGPPAELGGYSANPYSQPGFALPSPGSIPPSPTSNG